MGMLLIERYIFRRATQVLLFTLGALVAALWVTQVLRELDVVTAKGQAISIFLLMTVFGLPALVQVVAPIAFLVAAIVTLNNLGNDGELPVISAAGGSPKAVNRPIILLGLIVMLLVAFSHHVLAPASLVKFRQLLTQVRADVIATLVREGGFRAVDNGLTMHFRYKAPDGSFRDVFVNDERDPAEAVTFSAAIGVLLQHAGGSFLVLRDGDLIRTESASGDSNVVSFDTYALDLSQLGSPDATPVYQAEERSTLFLLSPQANDSYTLRHPERVRAELLERTTAPFYTLAFAFIALAFLGRPHSNRNDRSAAIAAVVVLCLALRTGGFIAYSVSRNVSEGIPFMYAVPLVGIVFGFYGTVHGSRARAPRLMTSAFDWIVGRWRQVAGRFLTLASIAGQEKP
jgi:lipopolysaccharide export system permease protein